MTQATKIDPMTAKVDALIALIEQVFSVSAADLHQTGPGADRVKTARSYLWLVLRFYLGLSCAEVAERFGRTPNTVAVVCRNRLALIWPAQGKQHTTERRRLAEALKAAGYVPDFDPAAVRRQLSKGK